MSDSVHARAAADTESPSMVREFRKLLGAAGAAYTDSQVEQLQREMETLAKIAVDLYTSSPRAHEGKAPLSIDACSALPMMRGKGRLPKKQH